MGYEGGDFNLYAYVANDPLNRADPTGLCDTWVNCLTGGTFQNSDGTVSVESSVILRAVVPGQVAWDNARTSWANGDPGGAALNLGVGLAEQAVTVATAGTGTLAQQGTRAAASALSPTARGVASEARVLSDMGLSANTQAVATAEGRAIPDALTDVLSVEIKDAARVSATRQVRIQTDAASASGRQSVLVTGTRTHVTAPAQRRFDEIIRRDDLGPQ